MPAFDKETIRKLSRLARIEIPEEEMATFETTLKQVVGYFDQLQEVDVTSLTPYSHVEEQGVSSLRNDTPGHLLERELFLKNAPDQVGSMIKVPPILKQQ